MKRTFLGLLLSFFSLAGHSQNVYTAYQQELIFSLADMNTASAPTSPVVRFSGFLNHETQVHFTFGKTLGMFSGLGIRNIGMINHFDDRGINFKQRAYALGIPLALKLGSMEKESYIALGGELNLMTHYKQKFLYNDTKSKQSEWFSDKVNLLNPAVFFQIVFNQQVLTFKYFLDDFLQYQSSGLTLPDGTLVTNYGRSSKLFYVSLGFNVSSRSDKKEKAKLKKQKQNEQFKTARWEE